MLNITRVISICRDYRKSWLFGHIWKSTPYIHHIKGFLKVPLVMYLLMTSFSISQASFLDINRDWSKSWWHRHICMPPYICITWKRVNASLYDTLSWISTWQILLSDSVHMPAFSRDCIKSWWLGELNISPYICITQERMDTPPIHDTHILHGEFFFPIAFTCLPDVPSVEIAECLD